MDFNKILNSLPVKIFALIISVIISIFFSLIIFSMLVSENEEIPEKYNFWIVFCGVAFALIVNFIVEYNSTTKLKYNVSKAEAEIKAAIERRDSLLDKATRVSDKYAGEEKELYSEFAQSRKGTGAVSARVRTSGDFKAVVESYPELKANEHVHKLISQIESSENILYNAKNAYADKAAKFNTKIHTFPIAIFRKLFKWEDISTEALLSAEEEITDEQLGI